MKMKQNTTNAIPGFTKVIDLFAQAQKKMEPDAIPIFLYVMDKDASECHCFLCTTFFAKINEKKRNTESGFSLILNKTILEEKYDTFVNSELAKVFTKKKGVIDTPGCLQEKCVYYIKDFGYDAEEASAVIAMLLKEVFDIKPEDVTLHIPLLGWDGDQEGSESTKTFDWTGREIAKSGFEQELF